ncbi:MAG TPA: hypothetical protein VGD37_21965, partial [Kofleriaceae bacterium]
MTDDDAGRPGGVPPARDAIEPAAHAPGLEPPDDRDASAAGVDGFRTQPGQDRSVAPGSSQPPDGHADASAVAAQTGGADPARSRDDEGADDDHADTEPMPPDLWDRAAAWLMQHGALWGLGVITLAMVAIYGHMFAGELAGDDLTFHMAESARIADCLRAGDFDFWNPSANAGFASAYYYQVVPQLASAIPAAIFGHHLLFFQLSVFLPLVLAPAAAYRGMRLVGATPWQAAIAALAIGFTNGESRWGTGNAGTFQVGLYTQTWALAAFPLALGHAVRWASSARGLAPAIAWGTFVSLCHPFAGFGLGIALFAGWVAQLLLRGVDRVLAELAPGLLADRGELSDAVVALGNRWSRPPPRPMRGELVRLAIFAVALAIACMAFWLPLVVDYAGFGGFPHRVNDEVGPGFGTLLTWYSHGGVLDYARPVVLTWTLPIAALLARGRFMRWLWTPAAVYAVWLGLGPHLPKTDDDLVPAVRFLGAMQVVMSLAIGAGFVALCASIWNAPEGSALHRPIRRVLVAISPRRWRAGIAGAPLQYGVRTGLAAITAALGVLLVFPGGRALISRVHVLGDFENSHGAELHTITQRLQTERPGRKQVGPGAENHWWNLLSYEYGRRPSLLMMGGGGLQASPNYDFLWNTSKEYAKNAWVYDAPLLVFEKKNAASMPPGDLVFETKNYMVRRLPAPGLVSAVEVSGALKPGAKRAIHAAAIDWYKTGQPLENRVLAYPGSGGAGGPPHGSVVRSFRQDSPGDAADLYAEVDATATTTFVARESWHPRWHAYLDGAPVPIRRVTPDFPAVDVPAGHHVLALRFERPWWAQVAWLAWPLISLAAWLATRR